MDSADDVLREDVGFILYRGEHSSQPGFAPVLVRTPSSSKSLVGALNQVEHEYSLNDERD